MAYSLRARVVVPMDRAPIEHGVVTVEGDRIVAVGTAAEGGEVIDLGDVALLPGLVNAHTHLEFNHLPRPLGAAGMPLCEWIRLVITERGRSDRNSTDAIAAGLAESLRYGVTTVGEIGQGVSTSYESTAIEMAVFLEVIGFSLARADSAFEATLSRLDAFGEIANAQIGVSPHAPYTVSPALLRRLVHLASSRGLPVAMHLAESAEELQFLASGAGPFQELLDARGMWDAGAIPRGSRPLDYLRMLAKAPRVLVVHGNYLDSEEQEFLATNADRMSLVYCPRTHAYFRHNPYPLAELLDAGVRVALGTDSRASNPDLDLLAEMRFVARRFPEIDPAQILRMGTLNGAEALGNGWAAGSIAAGKLANLVIIPLPETPTGGRQDATASIVYGDEPVSGVWIRGQRIGG